MSDGQTVTEIIDAAKDARNDLADLEQEFQEQLDEIKYLALREKRVLTDKEKLHWRELRANQAEVRDARDALLLVTLARLSEPEEAKRLTQNVTEISLTLSIDLGHLKQIGRLAELVGQVEDALAGTTQMLSALPGNATTPPPPPKPK